MVDARSGDPDLGPASTRAVFRDATVRDAADADRAQPELDAAPQHIGRYSIHGVLGHGGMGVVYDAYDDVLDRPVALKLVRSGRPGAEAARRLVREAQSIAQLSHPNVVEVFEIGRHGDEVFIAMARVEGTSLRRWLALRRRTVAEVLAVLQQAGQGLAAAHRAGIIHRDFKPDNVMVSSDGRVRVLDFGLARPGESVGSDEPVRASMVGDDRLTQTGTTMGTPAYMAPEQFVAAELDARTDQFAFCVVAIEALSGARPFDGDSLEALALHKTAGRINPAAWRGVPHRMVRALRRGLASRREDRWPEMDGLLDALRGPGRGRVVVATAALVAVIAGVSALAPAVVDRCAADDTVRAEVWDDARREAVRAAIVSTGVAHADATWERVRAQLDARVDGWALAVGVACRTANDRDASVQACLEQRRIALGAAVDALAQVDASTVRNAERVGATLEDAEACLRSDHGATLASTTELVDARTRSASAAAWIALGRYPDALAELAAVSFAEGTVDREGIGAQVQLQRAAIARATGDDLGAVAAFERAYFAALEAQRDELAVRASAELASEGAVGYRDRWQWAAHARAALARIDTGDGSVVYDRALCALQRDSGALTLASEHCARALAAADGPAADVDERIAALRAFATVRTAAGELSSARDLDAEALAAAERAWGAEHPGVADALEDLGRAELRLGHRDAARQLAARALALRSASTPEADDDPRLARTFQLLAAIDLDARSYASARSGFERALALRRRQLGESHPDVAESWHALALVQEEQGETDAALGSMAQAAAIEERLHPLDIARIPTLRELARMAFEFGAGPTAGREHLERAWEIVRSSGVPLTHPLVKDLDHGYGETLLALGEADAALEYLERFVADPRPSPVAPHVQFVLGRALWKSGRDPARALRLVHDAAQTWATPVNSLQREQLAAMQRWSSATDDGRTHWDEGYRWTPEPPR